LTEHLPQDDCLGSLQVLIDALEQRSPVLLTQRPSLAEHLAQAQAGQHSAPEQACG
jgi:hypothetical protein